VSVSPRPESILIVRLGAMGDVIHTLTAATALRTSLPDLRIGWVVEDRWSELLCARNSPHSGPRNAERPVADIVHIAHTKRWRKSPLSRETCRDIQAVRREIREQQYEVAIDFQGALKSGAIARLSGAKSICGFARPRETPARLLYNQTVSAAAAHIIDQNYSLAEAVVGSPVLRCPALLPRDEHAENVVGQKLASIGENFALINPGAGWGAKQWPAGRYGAVASALSKRGLTPLINFGPGEQSLALQVQEASAGTAQPISCPISELIALTRLARLFIGGDTGPLHLAAALQVPVVAIFGPTDPARNGPYGTRSIVLRSPESKTSLSHTNVPDPGLLSIPTDQVISAAHQLLESSGA